MSTGGYRPLAGSSDFEEGVIRSFRVAGRDLAVVAWAGCFYAFENACTHSAFSFDGLRLTPDGTLVCAAHFARFDAKSGRVLSGPAAGDLPVFAVKVQEGQVMVSIDSQVADHPLSERR